MSQHLAPEPDDASVRDLLLLAGRRPEPPAFRTARVRAAVEAEWRRSTPRRSRWPFWSVAAAAVLGLALVLWARTPAPRSGPPSTPLVLATLARVTGPVTVSSAGSAPRPIAAGALLSAGTTVATAADGRALLTLPSGGSLRLDHAARVVLETTNRMTLEHGRVFVDSGEEAATPDGLQIATRSGVVREIGTQFEVDAAEMFIRIRVREGAVRVEQTHASIDVAEAEAVRIGPDGASERRAIAVSGPEWSWIETVPTPFAIEGAALEKFLHWVTREQGWTWRFGGTAAARHGKGVVLHGTIEGLTPAEALEAVLPTCGMTSRLHGARLIVDLAPR